MKLNTAVWLALWKRDAKEEKKFIHVFLLFGVVQRRRVIGLKSYTHGEHVVGVVRISF